MRGFIKSVGYILIWWFGSSIIAGVIAAGINSQGIMRVDPTILFFPVGVILGIYIWVWRNDRKANV